MKIKIYLLWVLMLAGVFNSYGRPAVLPDSILHIRNGLSNFFQKLNKSQPVTIGYLGGSITEAAGYRVQTEKYFKDAYPNSSITAINAGVGGTGSALGAFRVQPEVLQHKPDLVFVEFAVNDAETNSLMIGNAMEGIVRQIKAANIKTDICFLYTVYEPMLKSLQAGVQPRSVRIMERIAAYYQLPSINLSYDVLKLMNSGDLIFHGEPGKDYGAKIVFTTDGTHPGTAGHTIYTQTIIAAFSKIKTQGKFTKLHKPLYNTNFQKTAIVQPSEIEQTTGWTKASAEKDLQPFLKSFPGLMYSANVSDSITIKFRGTYAGIGDVLGPSATGGVVITVDGKKQETKLRFDSYCWFYRRSFYLIGPLPDAVHTITIKKANMNIDKAKITGSHSSVYGSSSFEPSNIYIGNVMIIGEKL